MHVYTTIRNALLATTLAAALAGCTAGEGTTSEPAAGTNRPSEVASDPAAAGSDEAPADGNTAEEEPAAAPPNPKFGEAYTWEDGLQVTVGAPQPYEPSEFAFVESEGPYLQFPVTIVNGTDANFDPNAFFATLQSSNVEAEQIFDSGGGLEGSPSTTLLPGREAVFRIGFAVADPADIVMEVAPGFEYESAIWTS